MKEEARGGWGGWVALLLVLVALAAGVLYLVWKQDVFLPRLCQPLLDERQAECERKLEALRAEIQRQAQVPPPPGPQQPSEEVRRWAELTGSYPEWPKDIASPRECEDAQEEFRAVCKELDARPYLRSRLPEGGTYALLLKVGEELAARPPVASGELLQHQALVANAFHLFRELGKERMDLLREILTREQSLAEPLTMALYRFLMVQELCWKESSRITFRSLYDYAAYLLNTLGGQGYIRRRSPRVSALASFYALLIVDQAVQRGINPHGVDVRPQISLCREILKTQDLVFKDRYLETLQAMESRWERR